MNHACGQLSASHTRDPARPPPPSPTTAASGRTFMSDRTCKDGVDWRAAMAPYTRPRMGRSLLDLATSVVPYIALSAVMYLLLDVSYWLALVVAVPAAGFLLRTFIVFHDCAHGSFLPSKRANTWLGRVMALLRLPRLLGLAPRARRPPRHSRRPRPARRRGRARDDRRRSTAGPLDDAGSGTGSSATRSSCSASVPSGPWSSSPGSPPAGRAPESAQRARHQRRLVALCRRPVLAHGLAASSCSSRVRPP